MAAFKRVVMVVIRAAVDDGSLQKFMQRILGTKKIDDLGLFALGNRRDGKHGLHLLAADDLLQNIQCHLCLAQFFLEFVDFFGGEDILLLSAFPGKRHFFVPFDADRFPASRGILFRALLDPSIEAAAGGIS